MTGAGYDLSVWTDDVYSHSIKDYALNCDINIKNVSGSIALTGCTTATVTGVT